MNAATGQAVSVDGVRLALYDQGNRGGPEILFIHGFSQCSLCWQHQFNDAALAGEFRLCAFDLRGHGASGKPEDPARYGDDGLFAADVAAAIEALGLRRPLLVGWSYAGRVIADYLGRHGTGHISGVNYVCARTLNDPAYDGPGTAWLSGMTSPEVAANVAATRAFLRDCFAREPDKGEFETALAYNMLVPPAIRAAHLSRAPDDGAILARIDVPVLVSQGSEDRLVLEGLGALTAARVPGARYSLYRGIGHAPFSEDALRFNRELADFMRSAPVAQRRT
jgi:non-heme chloroperoxidase